MGNTAKLLGKPYVIHIGDKDYKLRELTDHLRAEFETYLESQELAALEKHKQSYDRETYIDLLSRTHEKIAAGYYSFPSQGFYAACKNVPSIIRLLWLVMRDEQNISEEQVKELAFSHAEEIKLALEKIMGTDGDDKKKVMESN